MIDDERMAREELKRALLAYPDFEVIAEAADADEAKEKIDALNPHVLFLDIKMPEKSGFELLESLDFSPEVVFTTAFDQYAVKAFDVNALDYLVKPVRTERFEMCIGRIRDKIVIAGQESGNPFPDLQLFIKEGNRCFFLKLSEVYLIESADNYACLHFSSRKTYVKRSLNKLEERLDKLVFFRINRKQIINTTYIKEVEAPPGGKLRITLQNGETVSVSGRQSVQFKKQKRL